MTIEKLDELVESAIRDGVRTLSKICDATGHADNDRPVDRSLQRLRKRGKITYRRGVGWHVVADVVAQSSPPHPVGVTTSPITPTGPQCIIWSGEHGAWWRPESRGYTERLLEAGVFEYAEAAAIKLGTDSSKQIRIDTLDDVTCKVANVLCPETPTGWPRGTVGAIIDELRRRVDPDARPYLHRRACGHRLGVGSCVRETGHTGEHLHIDADRENRTSEVVEVLRDKLAALEIRLKIATSARS